MKKTNVVLLVCGLVLASVSVASAQGQDQPARGFVSLSGGFQLASQTFTESGSFTLYEEPGSFTGSRTVSSGPFFDIGGGVRVFGKLSVGVAYSRFAKSADGSFTVVTPHPLFFNQPRTGTLNVTDLGHTENAVHVQLFYQVFSRGRFDASVFGGPSVISVKEDSVKAVTATETGSPYTAVNLSASFESASKTAVGVNVGLDANYRVSGSLGAGFFFRYVTATASLPVSDGTTRSVKAGGPQVGFGLRYRF